MARGEVPRHGGVVAAGRRVLLLARDRDVLVAAVPLRAVADHHEVRGQRREAADDGLVVHRAVVEVGDRRQDHEAGPFAFGFWIRSFTFTYSSTMPLSTGNAPVPIIAWPVGVFDGDAPTVACVNHAPPPMIDFRYG